MLFPRPIVESNFNNEYDMMTNTLSALLDRFEKDDRSFAAQCISGLASII